MNRRRSMRDTVRIVGIDPGSRITGIGIVDAAADSAKVVHFGGIRTAGTHLERLKQINLRVTELIGEFRPDEIAIEQVFVAKNASSALKLGQARAAALCATFGDDIPVFEYSARHIKKALTGSGAADKAQMQYMVRLLLGIRQELEADAADALAVALCHGQQRNVRTLVDRAAADA